MRVIGKAYVIARSTPEGRGFEGEKKLGPKREFTTALITDSADWITTSHHQRSKTLSWQSYKTGV